MSIIFAGRSQHGNILITDAIAPNKYTCEGRGSDPMWKGNLVNKIYKMRNSKVYFTVNGTFNIIKGILAIDEWYSERSIPID